MSEVERYMTELGDALHVRGARRRRVLRECRDHLDDAAAGRGEAEAVRAFRRAQDIAAALDVEAAARRGVMLTTAAIIGPALASGALAFVVRAYAHTRRLGGARTACTRSPLPDLSELTGFDIPVPGTA